MRLYVYVFQAKDLPFNDKATTHVKLKVGHHKSVKTKVSKNSKNPVWNEEFVFRIHRFEDHALKVSIVMRREGLHGGGGGDFGGLFSGSGELVGRVRIPVRAVAAEQNQSLPPTWFSVVKCKSLKFVNVECGKVLLSLSLRGKRHDSLADYFLSANPNVRPEDSKESDDGQFGSSHGSYCTKTPIQKIGEGKKFMKTIANHLEKVFNKDEEPQTTDSSSLKSISSDYEDCVEEYPSTSSFEEAIETAKSKGSGQIMPENLQGGVLLDETYVVSIDELNVFLFAPDSQFMKELAEVLGTTDVEAGHWTWKSGDKDATYLTRNLTYIKPATKLVKSVKAFEEQTYMVANGQEFAVIVNVSTPDVPCGNTFNVQLLYKIVQGPDLATGEESSRLTLSWGVNFRQNSMMKPMIESGVRQGLKDSFDQFASLLGKKHRILDFHSVDSSDKDHMLSTLEAEHQSDWELASKYFCNFTVVSTIFMAFYFIIHILLCEPSPVQGLEFIGIDLPDSFGQLISCAVLVLQLERVYYMAAHFVQARLKKGSDHNIKASSEGWVLTVALIEGTNLASLDSTGSSDSYVVFTCNGKTRTSSVKLHTSDPQWNDILEFDAMEEPPSVLDVEVFDFDGPFDQAASLGHAEINFLKHTPTEMADMWVSLEGKLAQSCQSKLHLRIFLDNNKGVETIKETIKEYLMKMEKEVGKKLNLRSPQSNSTFQKLFGLPPDEFLINDFTCHLWRKMPSQGKLFLSARTLGFYANLFGHKTKFFFLWEDIDDIQVHPPSFMSVGSPSLVIVLKKDKGQDAKNWAKSQDEAGRLRYYFQTFGSFNVASRTIMALWKARTQNPEQKAQSAEEQLIDEAKVPIVPEDSESVLHNKDAKISDGTCGSSSRNSNSKIQGD